MGPLFCNAAANLGSVLALAAVTGAGTFFAISPSSNILGSLVQGMTVVRRVLNPIPSTLVPAWMHLHSVWTWGAAAIEAGKEVCQVRACTGLASGSAFDLNATATEMNWNFRFAHSSNMTVFNGTLFQVDATTIDVSSRVGSIKVSRYVG